MSTWLADQLAKPRGVGGAVIGAVLSRKNRTFNEWVADQLHVQDEDRVLEIGCGPGTGLQQLAVRTKNITGVDYSPEMIRQAHRRNRQLIDAGHVRLVCGDVEDALPGETFDKVMAVHVVYFWQDAVAVLTAIRRHSMPSGGRIALGFQAEQHFPSRSEAGFQQRGHHTYSEAEVAQLLERSGFEDVDLLRKGPRDRPDGFCALGTAA